MQPENDEKFVTALRRIALMGGLHDYVALSSRELGDMLEMSQQSASKRILELLDNKLIERDLGARRQRIRITTKGTDMLRREYIEYQKIFEMKDEVVIKGSVVEGMGEGQYYVTQPGYMKQFMEKLGFKPYEGTLNVKLLPTEHYKLETLRNGRTIDIMGFERNGRTFGDVHCIPASIQNVGCAVVLPRRSHYEDVLEVVCKYHLRRTLSLDDGDEIEVRIHLNF